MVEKQKGKVFLVGAGPGDPGLLTLRGARILQSADAVVYDRLVNPVLLKAAPYAEKIFAGKGPKRYLPQEKINRLLVRLARQNKSVVRLKGGDPFIFGRGGEEASVLKRARIPFEVVPGVSAAYGVPAYAGIPVTDRRFASAVTLLTAHEGILKDKRQENWAELARLPGTLVLFMGVKTLPKMIEVLLRAGKSPATLISVIEQGTIPGQRVVEGTLRNILRKIKYAKIHSPALAVIGEVNRLRRKLDWFHPKAQGKSAPLLGKTVLITRAGAQGRHFKEALEAEGAFVRDFPVIRILPPKSWKPLDQAIRFFCLPSASSHNGGEKHKWIVFTSVNGVDAFFQRLAGLGKDSRFFSRCRIAAIGEATRERLLEKGIEPDLVPEKFTSERLVSKLARQNEIRGRRFLLPRTDIAPPFLKNKLEKQGAKITQVTAYRTVPACGAREKKILRQWLEKNEIDFVTFTSASTADFFFALLPKQKRGRIAARLVSIGPVTSAAIRKYGARPWREAREHTMKGMLEVMKHE